MELNAAYRRSISVTILLVSGMVLVTFESFTTAMYPQLKFTKHANNFTLDTTPFSDTTTHTSNECFAKCVRERNQCAYLEISNDGTNPPNRWYCRLYNLVRDLSANLIKTVSVYSVTLYTVDMPTIHCQTWRNHGHTVSDVYNLVLDRKREYQAYCNMNGTAEEGWTVINKRIDGSTNFDKSWTEYEVGFGQFRNEYWLGNSIVNELTTFNPTQQWFIKLEGTMFNGQNIAVIYKGFKVGNSNDNYILTTGTFESGPSAYKDEWLNLNNRPFTTSDNDNDNSDLNCAESYDGNGWWHDRCFAINFNAKFSSQENIEPGRGIIWASVTGYTNALKSASMAIRPAS